MANNNSLAGNAALMQIIYQHLILVQFFVTPFLCINITLIVTFFMKDFFYTTTRYILFANTLLSDCLILIITNILLICSYFRVVIQVWQCLILYAFSFIYTLVTPFTLTAMTLERYVAICMPLRHGELSSTRSALHCIVIIHGISSVPCIVILFICFASASLSFYTQYRICAPEVFIFYDWQNYMKSAMNQFYFLIMCIILVFSYVKILKVAKAASGENKKSTWKGLRTVMLHAFQLLLCLIQLWCPFIESAVFKIDYMLYNNIRIFNYITFYLAPRCLSPLVYGLRDEKFFIALKYYTLCGLCKNNF